MNRIISKLSVNPENKMYLINNVSVGLSWAIKHEKIKSNKEAFKELKKLHTEASSLKIPFNYKDINYDDIIKALMISDKAIEILKSISF